MNERIKINNIVMSADLGRTLDLQEMYESFPNVQYEPKEFEGLVYRITEPEAAHLFFSSGKVITTGTKSKQDSKIALDKVVNNLREAGFEIPEAPMTKIEAIVFTINLGCTIDLDVALLKLENAKYDETEDERFIAHDMVDPSCIAHIFSSGRCVMKQKGNSDNLHEIIEPLISKLTRLKIIDKM